MQVFIDIQTIQSTGTVFFLLLFCHFLADFPLQGDFMARAKDPRFSSNSIWPMVLFGHCMIHAGFVLTITKSINLAVLQLVSHAFIDYAKCKGWFGERYGFVIDQLAHIAVLVVTAVLYAKLF